MQILSSTSDGRLKIVCREKVYSYQANPYEIDKLKTLLRHKQIKRAWGLLNNLKEITYG